ALALDREVRKMSGCIRVRCFLRWHKKLSPPKQEDKTPGLPLGRLPMCQPRIGHSPAKSEFVTRCVYRLESSSQPLSGKYADVITCPTAAGVPGHNKLS